MAVRAFGMPEDRIAVLEVSDQIQIPDAELTFSYSRSSGPGGQNVNKVSSRATLRWNVQETSALPPGVLERFLSQYASRLTTEGELLLHSQRFRDQNRNSEDCLNRLREMILAVEFPPKSRKRTRPTRGSNQRRLKDKKQRSERKKMRRRPHSGE